MGYRYDASCIDCSLTFSLTKGGGWVWYQRICDRCGNEMRVPRRGPEIFEHGRSLNYEDLLKHLTTPSQWSRKGGCFDSTERKLLDQMTSYCSCGGNLVPEWEGTSLFRCPGCKSSKLTLENERLFD